MNVTITIYGDVHIHCDCCDECGVYDDNFDDALEALHEAAPDAEDGGEQTGPTAEEAEAAGMALAGVLSSGTGGKSGPCPLMDGTRFFFRFFRRRPAREAARMKEFDVTITETLKLTVSVEASSKEEAQQMVSDQWHAGDHILDADNFVEVEFESNDGKEISAERAPDDTIDVLMVEPGQYPRVERIGSDLASLQKAVDGYIEAIYPYDDPVALICGEEAKLEGKPLNRALRDGDGDIYDIVAGKFFLCGLGDENFASLPKELQQKYEEKFRQPEAFLKMGSKIMAIPTEPAKAAGKGKTAPVTER